MDRTTGRFYYIDHGTKTTHWNPPTSLLQYQAELQRQKTAPSPRVQQPVPHQLPTVSTTSQPKPIDKPHPQVTTPPVPRSDKPSSIPSVDRSSKPKLSQQTKLVKPMSVEVYKRKMFNLQPIQGSPVS